MGTGTEDYYRHWAPDYDEVYTRPERQGDMSVVRARLTDWFAGKHVLEVAAGTGWWTSVLADTAASVTATDVNKATLDVARARRAWPPTAHFAVADGLALQAIRGDFDAAFAGFFWSHVPLAKMDAFLEALVLRLAPGSLMVFADNRLVPGSVHPVARRDEQGNTFQRRQMADGSSWDVLKNFPGPDEVHARLSHFGQSVEVEVLDNYWLARCCLRGTNLIPGLAHLLSVTPDEEFADSADRLAAPKGPRVRRLLAQARRPGAGRLRRGRSGR